MCATRFRVYPTMNGKGIQLFCDCGGVGVHYLAEDHPDPTLEPRPYEMFCAKCKRVLVSLDEASVAFGLCRMGGLDAVVEYYAGVLGMEHMYRRRPRMFHRT